MTGAGRGAVGEGEGGVAGVGEDFVVEMVAARVDVGGYVAHVWYGWVGLGELWDGSWGFGEVEKGRGDRLE